MRKKMVATWLCVVMVASALLISADMGYDAEGEKQTRSIPPGPGIMATIWSDGFETNNFNGWDGAPTADWAIRTNNMENDYGGSLVTTHGGNYCANARDSNGADNILERTVDMTGVTAAALTFWWDNQDIENNDERSYLSVWDGSWHTGIWYSTILDDGDQQTNAGDWAQATVDLSGYNMVNNFIIRFTAAAGMDENEGGVGTNDDEFMLDDVELTGTIAVAPWIVSTVPADMAFDIAVDANVIITFSEAMNPTTLAWSISPNPGGWTETWSAGETIVTLSHSAAFTPSTVFIVSVINCIDANEGLAMESYSPWTFTTVGPPTIVATTPVNGATGVLLTQNVIIDFSKPMNTASLVYTCTPNPGGWVAAWSNGDRTVTLSHTMFAGLTSYTFTVTAAQDTVGNNLVAGPVPNPWIFTTLVDNPPFIDDTVPVSGAVMVAVTQNIVITFSETMAPATVTYSISPNPGGLLPTWSGGNTVLTIAHTNFAQSTLYTVAVLTAQDTAGNGIVDGPVPNPWSFRTYDPTPPYIISVVPAHQSTCVNLTQPIIVEFSEAMDTASVQAAFLCLPNPMGWYYSWNLGNTLITISHSSFYPLATYICQVTTSAHDVSGNYLVAGIVPNPWTFMTTNSTPNFPRFEITPDGDSMLPHTNKTFTVTLCNESGQTATATEDIFISLTTNSPTGQIYCPSYNEGVLVSFVFDDSRSMSMRYSTDGLTWLEKAKNAALILLNQLSNDSVCVSIWDFEGNNERRWAGPTESVGGGRLQNDPVNKNQYPRAPVRLGDTYTSIINGSEIDGRQYIRDEITLMNNPPGQTILWDAIGEAYLDTEWFMDDYPSLMPTVIVLSDGCDSDASDQSPLAAYRIEGGSDYWAPWAEMSAGNLTYTEHKGKYTFDWANPTTSTQWLEAMTHGGSMDYSRTGMLYPTSDVRIFTVGLGLESHPMPPTPSTILTTWPGETNDYTNALCTDTGIIPACLESGTLEYNLWRIADTSGAQYYCCPDGDQLGNIYGYIGSYLSTNVLLLRIPAGQSSATFDYYDYTPGKWAIQGSSTALGSDMVNITVLMPHLPIRINSNADFDEAHGVVNWDTGNGTEGNPWIIEGWDINGTGYGYCIFIGNTTEHFTVRSNEFHGAAPSCWYPLACAGLTVYHGQKGNIQDNVFTDCEDHGIFLYHSEYIMVANNSLIENISGGVLLVSSNLSVIIYNEINSCMFGGICLQYSHCNNVSLNGVSDPGEGIGLTLSNNNSLTDNIVHSAIWGVGININADDNRIESNNFINSWCGMYMANAHNNTVKSNNIDSNFNYGIWMVSSDDNHILNNNISNSAIGLDLTDSTFNHIYHNIIINNSIQANDSLGLNSWDNGYPSGGNYWSDYAGTDMFRGSGQNIPGSDGIGDTPYAFDFAQDNYPLLPNGVSDTFPPDHMNEYPPVNGESFNLTPIISVDVIDDISGVDTATVRLYVGGFMVFYNLDPISDGYTVSYWHESGFTEGQVVTCRIVASDYFGNKLDFAWNFTASIGESFNITLHNGWNLLSFPLVPVDNRVECLFSSISGNWDVVKCYDSNDPQDPWKTYRIGSSMNDLARIDNTMGFWLHVTDSSSSLVIYGNVPVATDILLNAGWNLVGYPTLTFTETVANAFWGTGADRVEVFDFAEPSLIKEVGPTYFMTPGEGYWVHVPANAIWTVENTPGKPQIVVKGDNPETGIYEYITFSNPEPTNGDIITITSTILNLGNADAFVDVWFYRDIYDTANLINADMTGDNVSDPVTILIPSLGQADAHIEWVASPGGAHTIIVKADVSPYTITQDFYDPDPSDNQNSTHIFVTPRILLVDDDAHVNDLSDADTVSFMRASLEAADFNYDFTTVSGSDGPGYDYGDCPLMNYDIVIWMTGYTTVKTLTVSNAPWENRTDDVANLQKFLTGSPTGTVVDGMNGGSLWLISEGFWTEALTTPGLATFASTYMHINVLPVFTASLTPQIYGNESHPVTDYFADIPINTEERVAGTDTVHYWAYNDIPEKPRIALNDTAVDAANRKVFALSYDSDDYPADTIVDSRILAQTWDFSRITETSVQVQYAYKALLWLGNYSP